MNNLSDTQRAWLAGLGIVALAAIIIVSITRDAFVNQPWREISVSGTGTVNYTPDTARVTLGVHVESTTAQAALAQLTATTDRVIPAIEALGIAPENISTANLSLYPQYYYPSDRPSAISGYTADQQLIIEIPLAESHDLVGKVIQTASAQGANQVLNVTFEASNISDLRQEAVLAAIADARSRAGAVADAAGVKLGRVVSWWENPISVPGDPVFAQQQYGYYGYGGDMGGMGGGGALVPTGVHEVIVQVNLNYETK